MQEMQEVIAAGDESFTLGFQLAGVRKTVSSEPDVIKHLLDNKGSTGAAGAVTGGVVIIHEDSIKALPENLRELVRNSVKPVFIAVSESASSDDLRAMIRKSIGIDVWEQK